MYGRAESFSGSGFVEANLQLWNVLIWAVSMLSRGIPGSYFLCVDTAATAAACSRSSERTSM